MSERPVPELPDVPALRSMTPPAGGLARLRDTLDDPPASRARWVIALAAVAAAIVLVWLWPRPRAAAPFARPAPRTLPDPAIAGGDVAFYWVASTSVPVAAAEAPTPPAALLPVRTGATLPVRVVAP